jgi:ubiquitin-conjugating enzyme E2 variant
LSEDPGGFAYSQRHRRLEIAGIVLFLGLLVYLTVRIFVIPDGPGWWAVGLCLAAGFLLADLISGTVHWAGDTIGDVDTPVVGKHFIKPFREHHVDPKGITRHDFVETNGNNCIASIPILAPLAPLWPSEEGTGLYCCTALVFTSWFLFGTNQFHKWAHADRPPRIARLLQRWRLILRPTHHDVHHASPHDKYYCITAGWLNPVLTGLRFFRLLEWAVATVRPGLLHLTARAAAVPAPGAAPASCE